MSRYHQLECGRGEGEACDCEPILRCSDHREGNCDGAVETLVYRSSTGGPGFIERCQGHQEERMERVRRSIEREKSFPSAIIDPRYEDEKYF